MRKSMRSKESNSQSKDLTTLARRGGVALFGRQGLQSAVQFAASVALARLLAPEEFGVAALAVAFAAFPQLFGDLGLGTYLIQARDVSADLFRRLFGLNLLVALGLTALQAGLAFAAAEYYGDQRVTGVLLVSALGHPSHALWSLHEKWLRRKLRFRAVAIIQLVFVFLSAAGCVAMAALGFSYWSLVWPPVLAHLLIAPAYWGVSKLPLFPRFSFAGTERPKGLLSFGAFTTGNAFLGYLANNADYLLIGRMLDAQALGLYTFAYTKAFTFSKKVLATAAAVALPVYSAAAGDWERLQRGFFKGLSLMLLFNVPLAALLASLAPVLLPLVFGERWLPAVLPFQILCIHVAVNALTSPSSSVTYAIGRPDIDFKVVAGMVPILVAAYAVGAETAGIVGVAAAVAVVKSLTSFAKVFWIFKLLRWKWKTFFRYTFASFSTVAFAAVCGGSVLHITTAFSSALRLFLAATAFLVGFMVLSLFMQFSMLVQGMGVLFPSLENRWPFLKERALRAMGKVTEP